ncbi:hypothetical protein [Nitrincola alkalilacustris]|uniref:hypothetical protein n=1 Tax=Nitrincola alkalilacustris TaxID=1571224 RepID=UPI00124BDD49|nr:hypothetical protein [Nitrincola alkalilacustris]
MTLERDGTRGFLSNQDIGTDALNALSSIDGVDDLEIVWETESQVQLSYNWTGNEKFWKTGEVLAQHGLKPADI